MGCCFVNEKKPILFVGGDSQVLTLNCRAEQAMDILPRKIDYSRVFEEMRRSSQQNMLEMIVTFNPEWTTENPRGAVGVDNYMITQAVTMPEYKTTSYWKALSDTTFEWTQQTD